MQDKELIQQALDGDGESFAQLYKKYLNLVYGYIYNKTGQTQDTQDLTSEVFMTALRSLKNYAGRSSFKNWLFGIVKHKLIDYYASKYKIEGEVLVEEIILPEIDLEDDSDKKTANVSKILQKLPENYRKVLSLRFLKGYKTTEIAVELGISASNVKVIQHRALKMAREKA